MTPILVPSPELKSALELVCTHPESLRVVAEFISVGMACDHIFTL